MYIKKRHSSYLALRSVRGESKSSRADDRMCIYIYI